MTILPKKKGEGESGEKHTQHAQSTERHSHQHDRSRRTSPTRWMPPTSQSHENIVNHNKRRHRSSPHRTVRKHRQTSTASASHSHQRTAIASSTPPLAPVPAADPPSPDAAALDETGYNSGDETVRPQHAENLAELEAWFETSLKEKHGLHIKKMGEDGACLFRAVADQIYGDQESHAIIRKSCIDYMAKNADFFKQYVTEDFNAYLNRKRLDNAHGNHIEMQAISEIYNRPVEVYQYSLEPVNIFHGAYQTDSDPIRISYHGSVHYNSVVDPYKATIGVGLGLPGFQPGLADKNLMKDATRMSENVHIEKQMLEDKLRETDWEVTQESIEEQVARESYLQWLKDNEKRAKRQASPRSASATCSSAADSVQPNWLESTMSPEPRTSRSPRQRSNNSSVQNSPNRVDITDTCCSGMEIETKALGNASPNQPSTSRGRCGSPEQVQEGAVGGAFHFSETVSIMNEIPPQAFGYCNEWDEDDILAQVMAQSQQEYLESLKKKASSTSPAKSSSNKSSSKQSTCSIAKKDSDMDQS